MIRRWIELVPSPHGPWYAPSRILCEEHFVDGLLVGRVRGSYCNFDPRGLASEQALTFERREQ
jgi:hypothetical protein